MTIASLLVASMLAVPAVLHSAPMTADECAACLPAETAAGTPATQPAGKITWTAYGEPTKLTDKDNIDAAKVLAEVKAYENKTVRLTGQVAGVCKKKGCWMKMSSGGSALNVFVHFSCPIDGRLIPMNAIGKPAIVEGTLTVKTLTEAEARHIAEEEGKTPEQVATIKGEQQQIEIDGPSALVAQ